MRKGKEEKRKTGEIGREKEKERRDREKEKDRRDREKEK